MDLQQFQLPLIVIGVVFIAGLSLGFVYKYSIKEKSYEEALAEQRQQTHALLGIKPAKNKDKKNKRPKKVKDPNSKGVESEELEPTTSAPSTLVEEAPKKPHVEFKEVVEVDEIKEAPIKKKVKKEKVKPILVNKEETKKNPVAAKETELPSANHFEESHPKDDFELLRSNSVDELGKELAKANLGSPKKGTVSLKRKREVKVEDKVEKKEEKLEKVVEKIEKKEEQLRQNESPTNGLITNTAKEKKKKKSEFNTLQQLGGDKNGANISIFLDLVRKAELSRSEVQILIDLLLNKQHEAPARLDEWSEGKSDPVQKLKKQLAEKEKLLAEEQEALQGAQAKLREVRAEQLGERSQLQQKIRQLDEILQNKQTEIGRLHAQVNEEILKQHDLRKDLGAMQMQRQQFEIRVAQAQETDVLIGQLQQESAELNSINQQLRLELQRLSEENVAEQEREQAYIAQLKSYQKELEQKTRQVEESRIEIEVQLEKNLRQENDFKVEVTRLNTVCQQQLEELRRLEHATKQIQDELCCVQKQKDEFEVMIEQLKEEKEVQSNGDCEEAKTHKIEILNLHNELSSVKSQLQQSEFKYKQELELKSNTVNKLEKELKEQKDKNNELREKNWKVMEALNAAEKRIKTSKSDNIQKEQDSQRQFVQRLFPEIKELNDISSENFFSDSEKLIKNYLATLQTTSEERKDSKELETQIQHYKTTIDNAEKMLNNLQKHIQQEEITWRMQLATKAAELDAVKEAYNQLKTKLSNLEKELENEQDDKSRIVNEYQEFRNRTADTGAGPVIEKLSEELNRLREQLDEQSKNNNGEINACPKPQNCSATNGPLIQEADK